ncbi:MAG: YqgE/AlgH family protein [Deltaproteobacteria bacterium]|nr:YqgE/AlgH family protein [Deltaproteobacteria bacterium]
MAIETELAAPCFLIAVPQLGDPNFSRGVVLMLEHGEEGSMGLVINRPSNLDMGTFCASQNMSFKGDTSRLIYHGGPVQTDRAFILHSSQHEGPETEKVLNGIRLSYSLESLRLLVDDPPDRMRIYLGYAGWGPDQLAEEITQGAWLVTPPTDRLVFGAGAEEIWEAALREMGIDPGQLMHSGAVH